MKNNKEKMDPIKKTKLIYSIELIVFSVIFLVLGILKVTGIFKNGDTAKWVFTWITIFGGAWGVIDFIWAVCSKKRQQRISMVDKFLLLPLAIYMIIIDIFTFMGLPYVSTNRDLFVGIVFFYATAIYLFEGIYHYYHPIPGLLNEVIEEMEKEQAEKEAKENENSEDNK